MPQAKSKHRRTTPKVQAIPSRPERFFQKELAGEEAPCFQTMKTLFLRAGEIYKRQPWKQMEEDELIAFEHPASGQHCYSSVIGALGRAQAVQVLLGEEGYFWFHRIQTALDDPADLGEFLAGQSTVFVHYLSPRHLERPDREIAKCMGHPLTTDTAVPIFRTVRPGYHPWFVTESEARTLSQGLASVLAICEVWSEHLDNNFWSQEGVYPLVRLSGDKGDLFEYDVSSTTAPSRTGKHLKLPELDLRKIESILNRRLPSEGILEVDHFLGSATVGAKYERKACLRVAMAIDAKTAFAYRPQVGAPKDSTGEMLQHVVLNAIEAKRALPREIHVLQAEFKILLGPLSGALACPVKVRESLPALEFAKEALNSMMRD